jgi:hypothetical protein
VISSNWALFSLPCFLVLGSAGCNSGSGDGAGNGNTASVAASDGAAKGAERDVCSFISQEEMSGIIGEPVVQTEARGETCSYWTENQLASVEVEIAQSGGAEEMTAARDAARILGNMGQEMKGAKGAEGNLGEMLQGPDPVPGLQAEAFFGSNQQLHVLKGEAYFAVTPPLLSGSITTGNPMLPAEKKRDIAANVARTIASRL